MPATKAAKPFKKYHALMPNRKYKVFLSWLLEGQNDLQLLLPTMELSDSLPRWYWAIRYWRHGSFSRSYQCGDFWVNFSLWSINLILWSPIFLVWHNWDLPPFPIPIDQKKKYITCIWALFWDQSKQQKTSYTRRREHYSTLKVKHKSLQIIEAWFIWLLGSILKF